MRFITVTAVNPEEEDTSLWRPQISTNHEVDLCKTEAERQATPAFMLAQTKRRDPARNFSELFDAIRWMTEGGVKVGWMHAPEAALATVLAMLAKKKKNKKKALRKKGQWAETKGYAAAAEGETKDAFEEVEEETPAVAASVKEKKRGKKGGKKVVSKEETKVKKAAMSAMAAGVSMVVGGKEDEAIPGGVAGEEKKEGSLGRGEHGVGADREKEKARQKREKARRRMVGRRMRSRRSSGTGGRKRHGSGRWVGGID